MMIYLLKSLRASKLVEQLNPSKKSSSLVLVNNFRLLSSNKNNENENEIKDDEKKIKVAGSQYFKAILSNTTNSQTKYNSIENLNIQTDKINYDIIEKTNDDTEDLNKQMNDQQSHIFARKFLKYAQKQKLMSNLNKGKCSTEKNQFVENNNSESKIFPDVEVISTSRDLKQESFENKSYDEKQSKNIHNRYETKPKQIRRVKNDFRQREENKRNFREYISTKQTQQNSTPTLNFDKRVELYDSFASSKSKKYLTKEEKYQKEFSPIKYEPKFEQTDIILPAKNYNLRQHGKNVYTEEENKLDLIESDKKQNEIEQDRELTEEEMIELDIENLRPAKRPVAYNLAYFVNSNPILQKLIEMGVQIRKWDEDRKISEFILRLDMEKLKSHLIFMHDLGLKQEDQTHILTKNPLFLKESILDLTNRINYLKSKKFDDESICKIISNAPNWLSMSVEQIDTRLGWYVKEFDLKASELRQIVVEKPKLVTLPLKVPSDVRFCLKEILCYENETIKQFLITFPKLFTKEFKIIEANFIFLSQVMKLSHDQIASYPPILQKPLYLIKSRYAYLKHLNRLQFDPTQPNFVSLKAFAEPIDSKFCKLTAKTSSDDYKKFLKSI